MINGAEQGMIQNSTTRTLCLLGLLAQTASGFESDNFLAARNFNRTAALTNSVIVVSVTFTNGGTTSLRGFYYADQVPSGLEVATLGVTLNGQGLTNYTFEAGQDGDVYAGCTPYRWVLEQPPAFVQTNPVPPHAGVQIVYSISSTAPGAFNLQEFSWSGYNPANTNASFGCSETADRRSVSFLTTTTPASVVGQFSTNGFMLGLNGVPGYSYAIEASTNLSGWVALVTNLSPFSFGDTNAATFPRRFYRARWLP